jgi:hypothetical protein
MRRTATALSATLAFVICCPLDAMAQPAQVPQTASVPQEVTGCRPVVVRTITGAATVACVRHIVIKRRKEDPELSRPTDRARRRQVLSKTGRQRQPQRPRQCVSRRWTTRPDFAPHYLLDDCPDTRRPTRPRRPDEPTERVEPTRPRIELITTELVLSEIRTLDFPASMVHLQPRGKTLVNLDTNVYADEKAVQRTLTVLTWPVTIKASPTSYTWHFGDGTTRTTAGPGAPLPDGGVSHKYLRRGMVAVRVTLNYDAWYQVAGGEWANAGIVSIPGPSTPALVCEARPVLVDPNNPDSEELPSDPKNPCTRQVSGG